MKKAELIEALKEVITQAKAPGYEWPVTLEIAAKNTGSKISTIRGYIKEGKLRSYQFKYKGTIYVKPSEFEEDLRNCTLTPC